MQAFGKGGVKAHGLEADDYLGRLYWFTVEFGLIRTEQGLRIYGSGIVSSKSESIYALESQVPHRLKFDVKRMMHTDYRFDDLQKTYFVIDSYEELFEATRPDFTPYYQELRTMPVIEADAVLEGEVQF
jgi:phenylalanine-4-hydroxylase